MIVFNDLPMQCWGLFATTESETNAFIEEICEQLYAQMLELDETPDAQKRGNDD